MREWSECDGGDGGDGGGGRIALHGVTCRISRSPLSLIIPAKWLAKLD